MEPSEPLIDAPTIAKVMAALTDIRKTYSTPFAKRAKLPKTLTEPLVKKVLEQVQTAEKQCGDVAGVAQHFGTQLQKRISESELIQGQVAFLQRRVSELESVTMATAQEVSEGSILSVQTQLDQEAMVTLKTENDGLKAEMRRLRREIARCETPKDQMKKQFLEFGLPLELQADIKALESKVKMQSEEISSLSVQLSTVTSQLSSATLERDSLQCSLSSHTSSLQSALQRCSTLESQLSTISSLHAANERTLKDTQLELMQERFLKDRLNR